MRRMTRFPPIILLALLGVIPVVAQDGADLWLNLSARAQNLHHKILVYGPLSGGLDFETHKEDLKNIERALDDLVSAGELESRMVEIRPTDELGDEKMEQFFQVVQEIATVYGIFVSSEMCDIGARMHFMTIEPNDPLRLHLRLPKDQLNRFIERLEELELINQTGAEHDVGLKRVPR